MNQRSTNSPELPKLESSPLLSIGMPIYNGAKFMRESIDSILDQDCEFELVISDNGSTDETESICRDYASRDCRVRYFRYEENRGAAWNYNNCFHLATGEFFKWAAHDDIIDEGFCCRCMEVLTENPDVALAYFKARMIDDTGGTIRLESDKLNVVHDRAEERLKQYFEAYRGPNICNPVFGVFRSAILRRTSLIGNYLASDKILLGEVAIHGKIIEIPDHLFRFRFHPNNSAAIAEHKDRLLWFNPGNAGKLYTNHIKWLGGFSRAVRNAELTTGERFHCCCVLGKWVWEKRDNFFREVVKLSLWPVLKHTLYRQRQMGV